LVAALCLDLLGCKHDHPAPNPGTRPAPADSVSETIRQTRLDAELKHARERWAELPDLGNCALLLKENADLELCRAANAALAALEHSDPAASAETKMPVLGGASLALVRLLDRARFLVFDQMGKQRLERDGGAVEASHGGAGPVTGQAPVAHGPSGTHALLSEHATLKMTDTPMIHLVENTARLERDALRNLGAYLEYAPLSLRRAAFDRMKQLQAEHPRWPTLNHQLREAAVLETDPDLKQNLNDLVSQMLPRGKRPDQPAGSK
jgi:hypothetical protein